MQTNHSVLPTDSGTAPGFTDSLGDFVSFDFVFVSTFAILFKDFG
jgi:hypothetical protein